MSQSVSPRRAHAATVLGFDWRELTVSVLSSESQLSFQNHSQRQILVWIIDLLFPDDIFSDVI